MPTEEEATVSTGDVTVTTEKAKEENHSVEVTITKVRGYYNSYSSASSPRHSLFCFTLLQILV